MMTDVFKELEIASGIINALYDEDYLHLYSLMTETALKVALNEPLETEDECLVAWLAMEDISAGDPREELPQLSDRERATVATRILLSAMLLLERIASNAH